MSEIKPFLDQNFLLQSKTAEKLYFDYAANMPIIDYHNHLIPKQIAENHQFENITQIWLYGDHYKWRAMRTQGVNERFITGDASDEEKFQAWAETVPFTIRNPLYHWTHQELQRPFGIHTILNGITGKEIYTKANEKLATENFRVQGLLKQFGVETLCTTDDPIDDLAFHKAIKKQNVGFLVLPTYRPDKAMAVENAVVFNEYVSKLEAVCNKEIQTLNQYLDCLAERHQYFHDMGCRISDHGLETVYAEDFSIGQCQVIFHKLRYKNELSPKEIIHFKSFMLHWFAVEDHRKGWTQQYHLGAIRNNNSRMMRVLGPDTGFDSIGDFAMARALAKFLDKLDTEDQLAKTILYNLNPADNALFGTMIGNFNDGSTPGKIQFGSGWWFLDQKQGMTEQMNALSNFGLLSRFVGMLTDSRSFLSFSRHEYFRRLLCNLIATDIVNGELPNDLPWMGKIVQDICYYNAKNYFKFGE